MATVREGTTGVLVVVDLQVGVVRDAWERGRIVQNVALAVDRARSAGIPVVWVQHSDEELLHGSPDWDLVPELVPAEGESRIEKHHNSSFEETDLSETLAALGATHLVVAGAATNWCIRATAYGALDRGYDLTLIKDGHTTEDIEFADGRRIPASNIVDELNVAMSWLSYPGRTNGVASAANVDFATPGGRAK